MELLELIDGISFTYDSVGVKLYYNKYRYKFVAPFTCISFGQNYYKLNQNVINIILKNGGDVREIKKFIEWRKNENTDKKIVTHRDQLTVYFNDPSIVGRFFEVFNYKKNKTIGFFRIQIPNYKNNTVYLSNPVNKLRMFLNPTRLNYEESSDFYHTMLNNSVKFCPSLNKSLDSFITNYSFRRFNGSYMFIGYGKSMDFDDESIITLVGLKYPKILGKIYKIETR